MSGKMFRYIWVDECGDPVISTRPQPQHLWRGAQGQARPLGWHRVEKGPRY